MQEVLMLLLGWLLGTLSPAIVDAIKAKRSAAEGRTAILNELRDVSSVLLMACYRCRCAFGKIDRDELIWLKKHLELDTSKAKSARFIELIDMLLGFPEDQLQAAFVAMATADDKATLLQKYPVPLVDNRMGSLQSFSTPFQIKLLEVRRNIALLEAVVDQSREFYRLTFEVSDRNHALIQGNLRQTYREYADRAKIIIDQVHALRTVV